MIGRFVLKASGGEYSFSLKAAGNSEILLTGERYTAKASALKGIGSHEVLGTSEMYSSNAARDAGIAAARAHAPTAAVDNQTRP